MTTVLNWKRVHLNFRGPLHLSRGRNEVYDKTSETLHSDTLKSALFAELKRFRGDDISDDLLDKFTLSSAFPFYKKGDEIIYFLPRPLTRKLNIQIEGFTQSRLEKLLKGVEYFSLDLFKKLFFEKSSITLYKKNLSSNGKLLGLEDLSKIKIFFTQTSQKVYVPQDSSLDTLPYYIDQIRFDKHAGLYFFLDIHQEEDFTLNTIKMALDLLSDSGIGTDKNNGYGHFDFDPDQDINTYSMNTIDNATRQMCLSLYCPLKDELNDLDNSSYDLLKRGGYIASPRNSRHLSLRKQSIFMFREGSVFQLMQDRKGKIVDLKPQLGNTGKDIPAIGHPIWRDGRALFLPIQL